MLRSSTKNIYRCVHFIHESSYLHVSLSRYQHLYIRSHIFVFVNCLVINPTFDSQTKETLTLRPSAFGSVCNISEKTVNAVVKSSIVESVLLWAQAKQQVDLKRKMKSGGGRGRDRILGVPKLEDANDAGTRHAM